jgi:hypothetical protein
MIHPAVIAATQIAQWPTLISGLTDALLSEKRQIDELIVAMRRQREAIAADDLPAVDDSVFAVQRILLTLGEARKRRRTLNQRLGQAPDIALRDLLEALGPHATDDLKAARAALLGSARALSRDVATNRKILRQALANGEDMVRALAGAAAPKVGYGDGIGTPEQAGQPLLVNRRA